MNNDPLLAGSFALPVPGTPAWFAQLTPESALNERSSGIYLGGLEEPVSERKLKQWRYNGGGPKFVRLGHHTIRYLVKDLDEFKEKCKRTSTLEERGYDR
jgi:hypothetical protein